jgi:hypothetical protein
MSPSRIIPHSHLNHGQDLPPRRTRRGRNIRLAPRSRILLIPHYHLTLNIRIRHACNHRVGPDPRRPRCRCRDSNDQSDRYFRRLGPCAGPDRGARNDVMGHTGGSGGLELLGLCGAVYLCVMLVGK